MSEGIGYALGAMLLYGVADYVYKRGASAGAPPHQFLMVQTWFFSSLALLYGLVSGTLAFNAGALWGAAAGVLVATVAVGIASFTYKLGLREGATPISLVAAQGAVAVTLSTVFTAYLDRRIRPSRAAWRHAPVAAALLVVAFTFLAKGLEGGEASVVVPVAQMGFVVTALLGFFFLREPFTARKCAGLAAALAALASLARG